MSNSMTSSMTVTSSVTSTPSVALVPFSNKHEDISRDNIIITAVLVPFAGILLTIVAIIIVYRRKQHRARQTIIPSSA